jgi:hypothetical protein
MEAAMNDLVLTVLAAIAFCVAFAVVGVASEPRSAKAELPPAE